MPGTAGVTRAGAGRVRYSIVAMLFAVTVVNHADRATLPLARAPLSKELGLSPADLGSVFAAFG